MKKKKKKKLDIQAATWMDGRKFSRGGTDRQTSSSKKKKMRLRSVSILKIPGKKEERKKQLKDPNFWPGLSEQARAEPNVWTGVFSCLAGYNFFSQNAILKIESAIYNQCPFWEFSIAIIRPNFKKILWISLYMIQVKLAKYT